MLHFTWVIFWIWTLCAGWAHEGWGFALNQSRRTTSPVPVQISSPSPANPHVSNGHGGADGHGSVRFLTDGAGAVTDTYAYDAYGNVLSTTGNTVNPYRYTGQQWDNDLGMYYLRARYYKPDLGRFWTMDTFMGHNQDPRSLHKYIYCHGDGVNFSDPSGHWEGGIAGFSVSSMMQGYLQGAVANVTANAVIHALVGKSYSGKEIAWDALTGGALGASGTVTKFLACNLGRTWVAKLAFQGGRHGVNALLGATENYLKSESEVNGEPSTGFNAEKFAIMFMVNFSATVAGDMFGDQAGQIIRDQKNTIVEQITRNTIRNLGDLKAWINSFKLAQRPAIEGATAGEKWFLDSLLRVTEKVNQKAEGNWDKVDKVLEGMLDAELEIDVEAVDEWSN